MQLAGIWEPETLHPDEPVPALEQKPDYFSIRGEVVYQNADEGWVMVKIIQFSRKKPDEKKPPYFNLKLMGFLPDRPEKNFWDLHVEREGTNLVIQDGERIAYLGKKKPKKDDKQRFRCLEPECLYQTFSLNLAYSGRNREVKQQIVEMTLNGSGVRDTIRVLQISTSTT